MKRLLLVWFALALAVSTTPFLVAAQHSPLPLGAVSGVTQLQSCPTGFLNGMTCFKAQMSCPNTANLGFTYGFENPSGNPLGTIVFLGGSDGTIPYGTTDYAQPYLTSGFQVVEFAWDSAWENTGTRTLNIQTAACRPATFLNFVAQNVYRGGGMCAQGLSAGSAAVAYTLAWYGGANSLDKVELISGPVFSDIEQGCVVPSEPTITVCPTGQFGCNGASWPDRPAYVGGDIAIVAAWTGERSCSARRPTSRDSSSDWKAMSIVDGTSNPSFSYPQTAMAGWLCSDDAPLQNNSAAQGEFFYQQFTSAAQTAGYSVTRIDECNGAEGIEQGVTPQGVLGLTAVTMDMTSSCIKNHR